MMPKFALSMLVALAVCAPLQEASAQESTLGGALFGGAAGAIVGGALGGGRGAAVGAIVGATHGSRDRLCVDPFSPSSAGRPLADDAERASEATRL